MLKKFSNILTNSALLAVLLPLVSYAGDVGPVAYKDEAVLKSGLPVTDAFVGYAFLHNYYKDGWENSYQTLTGTSTPNNFSGVHIGLDHMYTDWLALHLKFSYYPKKGPEGNDGRHSGLIVAGLGFYNLAPRLHLLGLVGASVGAFSHIGDGRIGTVNSGSTDADVDFLLGAGLQYQINEKFYLRPLFHVAPYEGRADSNVTVGFGIDMVYAFN